MAGSLPRPALTATGGARYPMNGPMSVDGGAGDNVLDITATELGDHLVLGESTVDGAGLGITHRSMGLVAVDALQGNDTVDVLATAPGVITLVVGGLGSDVINVAGDVVGDVLSRDPTGTPTTVNYLLTSADVDYATVVGPGVAAAVARATQGGVVVVDSGGDSHVRGLPNGTPIGTVDSVGVRLAAAPTSDVWVTVSAAASPLVQRPDSGPSADSVYVCTTSAVVCATAAGYFHTVYVDGVPTLVPNREAVLLFTSANWGTTQAVWFAAVNGTLAVPAFVTSISQSVISEDSRFMGMVVRNVAVAEQDALTPDLVVEQVGVGGGTDASTVVIEGTDVTRQTDDVRVSLSHAPVGTVTVSVRPSDSRVVLTSADSRFALGPVLGGVQTYLLTFAAGDWDIPVLLTVAATDDYVRQDRSITVLDLTVDDPVPGNDPAFDAVSRSLDVVVYDDDTAGLVATPSGGSTLVTPSAGGSPISDTVSLRLTKAPTGPVSVSFVTDGQVTPSVAVVVFDETNWWIPVVVSLSGTALVPPAGAGDLFLSPKQPHLLSAVRGDTLLEGGTLDNLHPADEPPPVPVLAPGEHDQARPGVPTQPSEARQVDVLGLFDDGSRADRSGVLTGAALLGMSDGLILFGEGDGTRFEVLNLQLGQGNDTLDVEDTLQGAPDTDVDDRLPDRHPGAVRRPDRGPGRRQLPAPGHRHVPALRARGRRGDRAAGRRVLGRCRVLGRRPGQPAGLRVRRLHRPRLLRRRVDHVPRRCPAAAPGPGHRHGLGVRPVLAGQRLRAARRRPRHDHRRRRAVLEARRLRRHLAGRHLVCGGPVGPERCRAGRRHRR